MKRLPDFLIIGAMRGGTTTLFRDLERHPGIFLPEFKEPEFLCAEHWDLDEVRARYARLFKDATAQQLCGEASTAYTKLPDYSDVPRRAREVCGRELKLLYIVREPLARARSAHHHDTSKRETSLEINDAMRREMRYLNYSRYAMQISAWLEYFPKDQFSIVRFESYVAARDASARRICSFLGLNADLLPSVDDEVHNKTANRPTSTPLWRRFVHGQPWYEEYLKPRIPRGVRRKAAELLLPRAPAAAGVLSAETEAWMKTELRADIAEFERLYQELWPEHYDPQHAYRL